MAAIGVPAHVGMLSLAIPARFSRPNASHNCATLPRCVARSRISPFKVSTPSSPHSSLGFSSSLIVETSMRGTRMDILKFGKTCGQGALGATCSLPASPETLRWVFVAAASVLLFVKNVGIPKQFLVPLLALELPSEAIRWIKGDFGLWTAFLALAVKLFYQIPGELELPLYLLLLVITSPAQLTQYRGSTPAAVATLALAGYLAYQHYKYAGSAKGAFENEKLIPTIAIVVLLVVPIVFLANGVYY